MKRMQCFCMPLLASMLIACKQSPSQHPSMLLTSDDIFIPKDSANRMIQSYLSSIAADSSDTTQPELHALLVNADGLRSYLADSTIKVIKLMLAHKLDYINSGHEGVFARYKADALTLVITGVDNSGNYVYHGTSQVANHSVPCPRNCPTGTAGSSLLE